MALPFATNHREICQSPNAPCVAKLIPAAYLACLGWGLTGCWTEVRYDRPAESADLPAAASGAQQTANIDDGTGIRETIPSSAPSNSAPELPEDLFAEIEKPATEVDGAIQHGETTDLESPEVRVGDPVASSEADGNQQTDGDQSVDDRALDRDQATQELDVGSDESERLAESRQLSAWVLGRELVLAAMTAQEANGPSSPRTSIELLADRLAVPAELLPNPMTDLGGDAKLEVLFRSGRQLGGHLTANLGREHAALFEIAFKSHLLLELFEPGSPAASAIAKAIPLAAEKAQLPSHLWQPLVEKLAQTSTQDEIHEALREFDRDVQNHLVETTGE
jgi:hypothetical protein